MTKGFDIIGSFEVPIGLSEEEFIEAIVDFAESKGWLFGGGAREFYDCIPIEGEPDLNFRTAFDEDAAEILALYKSMLGEPFCAWDESYPGEEDIKQDLASRNLFVMTDGTRILGALSVVSENELDGFSCWQCNDGAHKEIARVVVSKELRGKGLAYEMVKNIIRILRQKRCSSIRLSVAKGNIPAQKTYKKAGFESRAEAELYGGEYYLFEKSLAIASAEDERIARIMEMTAKYEKGRAATDALLRAREQYAAAKADIDALAKYYESPLWLSDFDADNKGLVPKELNRGILTEDTIYDLLTDQSF